MAIGERGLPIDPRGQELIKLLSRDQYVRWLDNEVSSLLLTHFREVTHTLLDDSKALTPGQGRRTAALFTRVNDILKDGYSKVSGFTAKQIEGYAGVEADAARAQLGALLSDTEHHAVSMLTLSKAELRSITALPIAGLPMGKWWASQVKDMTLATRQQIQLGMLAGEGADKIIGRIIPVGASPAVYRQARNRASMLVQTSITTVQNAAAFQSYKGVPPEASDSYMYVSARDERVTPICRALDGRIFKYKDPMAKKPPQHIRCRSTIVPVINWQKLGLEKPDDHGPLGFSSYHDWLKTQPEAKQDLLLGKGRADLWRAGKASLADMVNKDNRLLTLDQLREKITRVEPKPKLRPTITPKPVPEAPPTVELPPRAKLPHEMNADELFTHIQGAVEALDAEWRDLAGLKAEATLQAEKEWEEFHRAGDLAKREEARARAGKLSVERNKLADKMVTARNKKQELVNNAVRFPKELHNDAKISPATYFDQNAHNNYQPHQKLEGDALAKAMKHLQKGVDDFNAITGKKSSHERLNGKLYDTPVHFLMNNGRAYRSYNGLHLRPNQEASVVAHELAHALEGARPDINAKVVAWRNARQVGNKIQRMRDIHTWAGYDVDEITQVDNFMHPYMGKLYAGNGNTEVLSMGIEYLITDPLTFMEKDPDMFKFILSLFR